MSSLCRGSFAAVTFPRGNSLSLPYPRDLSPPTPKLAASVDTKKSA